MDQRWEATHVGGHDENGAKQVLEAIGLVVLVNIVIAEQFKHAGNSVRSKGRRQQRFRLTQGRESKQASLVLLGRFIRAISAATRCILIVVCASFTGTS